MDKLKTYSVGDKGQLVENEFGGFYLKPDADKRFQEYRDLLVEVKDKLSKVTKNEGKK